MENHSANFFRGDKLKRHCGGFFIIEVGYKSFPDDVGVGTLLVNAKFEICFLSAQFRLPFYIVIEPACTSLLSVALNLKCEMKNGNALCKKASSNMKRVFIFKEFYTFAGRAI